MMPRQRSGAPLPPGEGPAPEDSSSTSRHHAADPRQDKADGQVPGAQERGSGAGLPASEDAAVPARLGKRPARALGELYRSYTDCTLEPMPGPPDRREDPNNAFEYGVLDLEGPGAGPAGMRTRSELPNEVVRGWHKAMTAYLTFAKAVEEFDALDVTGGHSPRVPCRVFPGERCRTCAVDVAQFLDEICPAGVTS